jgi:hypothetical protein
MAPKKQKDTQQSVDIKLVDKARTTFCIIGESPFVCNAMSAKVHQDLLFPPTKKNATEKATTLKHDPMAEFRRSAYRSHGNDQPTRVIFPAAGVKKAMASAALELPGVKKAQIGRLCWSVGDKISLYGVPQMWMTTVKQAGFPPTPDVRTRAILPEWATMVTVEYVTPNMTLKAVGNLLASAGVFIGLGDGRPEKGALSYGRFRVVNENDEDFQRIINEGGREAQDAAFAEPVMYDVETEELMEWFDSEVSRRGMKVA